MGELDLYTFPNELSRVLFDYIVNEEQLGEQQESQTCAEAKRKLLNLMISLSSMPTSSSSSIKSENRPDYLIQIIDKYLFAPPTNLRRMTRFLQYYKNEIFQWVCKRNDVVIRYVLGKLSIEFVKSITLLTHAVEYAGTDKNLRKTLGPKLVHYLYDSWHLFKEFWENNQNNETTTTENATNNTNVVDRKLALVNLLTKSLVIESFQV